MSITQKLFKDISPTFTIATFFKYNDRSTDSKFEWVENLKSYSQYEFGIQLSINLTDNLYDLVY